MFKNKFVIFRNFKSWIWAIRIFFLKVKDSYYESKSYYYKSKITRWFK